MSVSTAPGLRQEAGWLRTFSAFRNPGYRKLWVGLVLFFTGIQMQMLAQSWLVYNLTGSSFALGIVTSMWSFAVLLFSLFGGAIADRVEKRDLLVWTQMGVTLTGAAVALLVVTGAVQVWHLVVASFVQGTVLAFHFPARQALIPDLVGNEGTMNAMALMNAAFALAGVAMPAVAGFLVNVIGVEGVYALTVLAFALTIVSYRLIPATGVSGASSGPILREVAEGLSYVWNDKTMLSLLVLALLPVIFGWPFQALLPAFSVAVLGLGAGALGLLMSANGLGAFFGNMVIASMGNFRRQGLAILVLGISFAGSMVVFAFSGSLILALAALGVMGFFGIPYLAVNNTMIQVMAPPAVRGRVISLAMMTWGLMPLGALPLTALADATSVPVALATGALLLMGSLVATFLLRRSLLSL